MTFFTASAWFFLGSLLVTAIAVLGLRRWTPRIGQRTREAVDSSWKSNSRQLIGNGITIFLVMMISFFFLSFYPDRFDFKLLLSPNLILSLVIVSSAFVLMGAIEDRRGMGTGIKVFCQIVAVSFMVGFAKEYSEVTFFGVELNLHHFFYPFSMLWLIGMAKAFDYLDRTGGIASRSGTCMAAATTGIAYVNGFPGIALIGAALTGCLAGICISDNLSMKTRMGRTGTMLIGLVLGTLILRSSINSERTVSMLGPVAIVLVPVMITFFAMIRQINSGRLYLKPDRNILDYIAVGKRASSHSTVLLLIQAGCLASLTGAYLKNDDIPLAASVVILLLVLSSNIMARHELSIFHKKVKWFFLTPFCKKRGMHLEGKLSYPKGKEYWRTVWTDLMSDVHGKSCRFLRLELDFPQKSDFFYGEWEDITARRDFGGTEFCIPMNLEDKRIGTLYISLESRNWNRKEIPGFLSGIVVHCENRIREFAVSPPALSPLKGETVP